MRNLEVRRLLQKAFTEVLPSYYRQAPEEAAAPYMVFTLHEVTVDQLHVQMTLNISIYGSTEDEERLEELLDEIEKRLHYRQFATNAVLMRCYRAGTRLDIDEDEPRLLHKRMQFELRVSERRNLYASDY